jgi:hypothetical protein
LAQERFMNAMQPSKFCLNALSWKFLEMQNLGCYNVLRHCHLICEIINRGDVRVCNVHMDQTIADPLAKPLPQPKHEAHMWSMCIRYLHQ